MVSSMHIPLIELSLYEDTILDACCNNISADDELWYRIVEVSVRSGARKEMIPLSLLQNLFPFIPSCDGVLCALTKTGHSIKFFHMIRTIFFC